MELRQLNDSEKTDVKKMFDSKGFKIMEDLVDEFETNMLRRFKTASFWDAKVIEELTQTQNYLKWVSDFINTIKWKTSWVWKRKKD